MKRSWAFLLQSPVFLHILAHNSAALYSVSWIDSLGRNVLASTDVVLRKKRVDRRGLVGVTCQHGSTL